MPIQTQCEHCGYAYTAPDALAGKRIRCRNCGQVFTLPASADAAAPPSMPPSELDEQIANLPPVPPPARDEMPPDQTRVQPTITKTESSMAGGINSAKSRMERPDIDPGMFEIAGDQQAVLLRPSTPFHFPYARDMDTWMPRIAPLLMLTWAFYMMWNWRPSSDDAVTHPFWGAFFPLGLSLVLLLGVWWPLFAAVMRKITRTLRLSLPEHTPIRSLCLASIAFGFASVFWLAGESLVTLTVGTFIGSAIAVLAAWFLYRLSETDLVHAGVACLLAGLASAALSVGVFAGGNFVLNHAMAGMKAGGDFYVSPLGPDLPWERTIEENLPKPHVASTQPVVPMAIITQIRPGGIITTQPATPTGETPVATTPPSPGRTQPPQPFVPNPTTRAGYVPTGPTAPETPLAEVLANNKYLTQGTILPIKQQIADVVYPLTPSDYMAVVSQRGGDERDVTLYKLDSFAPVPDGTAVLSGSLLSAGFALSPNGDRFGQVSRWAGGSRTDVWSFSSQSLLPGVTPLDTKDTPSRLPGFLNDDQLLCQWLDGGYELQAMVLAGIGANSLQLYLTSNIRYSPLVALIPGSPFVAIVASPTGASPSIQIWSQSPAIKAIKPKPIATTGFIPRTAAFNLMPTGLAVSPDGKSIAVAYQEGGRLQVFVCSYTIADDRDLTNRGTASIGWVPPVSVTIPGGIAQPANYGAALYPPNRLSWLRDDGLLLYGNAIISIKDRKVISTIDANVVQQKMVNAATLHLVIGQAGNLHVLETKLRPYKPTNPADGTNPTAQ